MSVEEIREHRVKKLNKVRDAGLQVFPHKSERTHAVGEVRRRFAELEQSSEEVRLAGRIRGWRSHGGSAFIDIEDGTGRIQAFIAEDSAGEAAFSFFAETFDVGDFAELRGILFTTKRGEPTLKVRDYRMLAKSLLPLPEKWHGLQDTEARYRRRYLDMLFHPEVREVFEIRAGLSRELRSFLHNYGFLEVETPVLQSMYGGAEAAPFVTHLNAFDIDVYLRIAPELYLKRLIIGGFEKVYEIGRVFRNEGVDSSHNPDFTMLEFYWAYADYKDMMQLTEQLFTHVLTGVFGDVTTTYNGAVVDFTPPWSRIEYGELLHKYADVDVASLNREGMMERARELQVQVDDQMSKEKIADAIYKKYCLPQIWEPTFVIHHPAGMIPLAKPLADDPTKLGSVQMVAAGWELVKAYSELNDPLVQRQVFEEQEALHAKGDEEAHRLDTDFVEALEYGMPPTAGFGLGLDRLTALVTDTHSLREVISFPTMRPKE